VTGLGMTLRQLLRDLATQKLRTFLTAFGIVWGTVAVSLLLAFGEGLHRQQTKSMAGLGDRIVIAWPSRTSKAFEGIGRGRRIRLSEADIEFLQARVPGITGISSEYSDNFKVKYGDKVRAVDVSGVSPVFGVMRNMIPQAGGRFIDPIDMEQRRRVVFVGNEIATDLFGKENPVGKEIMMHGSPFLVIGVLKAKDQDSNYSGRDSGKMTIPATTFRALTGQKYMDNFIYKAAHPELNKGLTKLIIAALGRRHHFDPTDDQAVQVWDTTDMFAFFDAFMLGFKVFLGLMGVLTLIVGGIGVSNIMNVVVDERTKEIGIKMALGARQRLILTQFLLETMALTGIGGAIGLGISLAICVGASHLGLQEFVGNPVLSPHVAAFTAGVLGVIGFLAGYFPARDAARLDPVVAMKL